MATNAPSTASRALLTPRALLRGRSWLGGVLAAFMLLFVVFGAPLQASAHDRLVSSDPAADSVVTAAPATVTLTFSDAILKVGSAIQVNDAAGKNWAEGELGIVGTALTTGVAKGMPNGAFTIVWRAVSSDGHPIEGQVPFKVELAATSAAAETPSAAAETPSAAAETTTTAPAATATSAATSAAATSSAAASNATASATMAPTAAPNPDATKDNESLGVPTPVLTGGSIPGIQGTPADIPGQNASSGVNPIYYWLFALLVVIAIVLIVRAVRARDEDKTQAAVVEAAATTSTPTTATLTTATPTTATPTTTTPTTSSAASVATTSAGVNPVQKPGTDTANHAATATSAAAKPNAEAATNAETVAAAEPAAPRARRAASAHPPVSAPIAPRGRRASNRVENDEQKPQ